MINMIRIYMITIVNLIINKISESLNMLFYNFYNVILITDWKCTNRTYNVHVVYINSNNKIYDADN